MNSKELGSFGEKIAENYLKKKGYQVLDRNYTSKFVSGPSRGEIDIVAKKDDVISFIEVKTLRQAPAFAKATAGKQGEPISPEEKVNFGKQRKLIRMAEGWLMEKKIPLDSKWQIDIISIVIESGKAKINHFENAIC